MILVVDNYDSFTWNLVHYLREIGARVDLVRNDALSAAEALATGAQGLVLSPGPGAPDRSGISLDLVVACAAVGRPLLGVCLGHQAIAQALGGMVERAPAPVHGKTDRVSHDGSGLFRSLPSPFDATRYHSLTVQASTLPACLHANAFGSDGTIQGLRHRTLPIHGVQFHPESIASQHGHAILRRFVEEVAGAGPGA